MAGSPRVSSLESHAGYWLRFVSNHVSYAFRSKVEARGVTVAEWVVLRRLFETGGGVHPSEVAGDLGMTRGAISKLVDRLAAKGLVRCGADRRDRRFMTLALTTRGRRLVPVLARVADHNDDEFFGHLGAARRSALVDLLRDVVRRRGLRKVPVD